MIEEKDDGFFDINGFEEMPEENSDNTDGSDDSTKNDTGDVDTPPIKSPNEFEEIPEDHSTDGEIEILNNLSTNEDNLTDLPTNIVNNEGNEDAFQAFGEEFKSKGMIDDDVDISLFKDSDSIIKAVVAKYQREIEATTKEVQSNIATKYKEFISDKEETLDSEEDSFLNRDPSDFEDNDELGKKLMIHFYKNVKGLDDRTTNTIIENTIDYETAAKEIQSELIEADKGNKTKLAEQFKAEEESKVEADKAFQVQVFEQAKSLDNFIPGMKVNDKSAKEIQDDIGTVLNKINNDLLKYGPLLSLFDKAGFMDGKFDVLLNQGGTQQVKKLDKILKGKTVRANKQGFTDNTNGKVGRDPNLKAWY